MQDLKIVLSNSIRGARYHWRQVQRASPHVADDDEHDNDMDDNDENHFD